NGMAEIARSEAKSRNNRFDWSFDPEQCAARRLSAARFRLDFRDHATVDFVVAHAAEDAVDVFQPLGRVVDFHLAFASELQTLGEIEARPDNRSPNGLAHQNSVEDVQLE